MIYRTRRPVSKPNKGDPERVIYVPITDGMILAGNIMFRNGPQTGVNVLDPAGPWDGEESAARLAKLLVEFLESPHKFLELESPVDGQLVMLSRDAVRSVDLIQGTRVGLASPPIRSSGAVEVRRGLPPEFAGRLPG